MNHRSRSVHNLFEELLVLVVPNRVPAEQMRQNEYQLLKHLPRLVSDVAADFIEVALAEQRMEREDSIFCKVQVTHQSCKVEGNTFTPDEVLPAQVLNGEADVMLDSHLVRRSAKIKTRL